MPWSKQAVLGRGTEDTPVFMNLLEEVVHFLLKFLSACFPSDVVFWGDLWLICNLL